MKRLALFLLFLMPAFLYPQERFVVDSLTMQLESLSQDSSKIKILLKLSDQFQYTDFKRSLEYVNSAL
ncbi:hypothetical protein, partial [Ancylomarina sp.]|uniref:hypothetical protein n=1 Tax=Ancylomarina sp. TaxID=1970196 RepID=UPI003569E377